MSENEGPIAGIFRSIPAMLAKVGTDSRIIDINPAWEGFTGYSSEEVRGKSWPEFIHPEDVPGLQAAQEKLLLTGKPAQTEVRVLCSDGSSKWVLLSASFDPATGVFWTSASDITPHKEADEALRASEHLLRRIVDKAPISMAIVGFDEKIEYINRKAEETFGYPNSEIPTMDDWWVRAYPDKAYREEVIADWMGRVKDAVARNDEIVGNRYLVTCRDGRKKTCFIFGVIAAGKVFVMFDDITARLEVQEAIRESEDHLRLIMENSPMSIAIISLDDRIEYLNPKFTQVFGYTLRDIPAFPDWERLAAPGPEYAGEQTARWRRLIKEAMEEGNREIDAGSFHSRCKDGDIKQTYVRAVVNPPHVVVMFDDITECVRTREALRSSEQTLRRILEQAPVALAMHSLDGKFEIFNRKFQQITGYAPADVPDLDAWTRLAYPDESYRKELLAFWTEQIEKSMLTGQEMDPIDVRITCKDGSLKQAILMGVVTPEKKIVALLEDVTQRRETERALRERESLYRSLVETTRTGYVVIDGQGKVVDANTEYVRLTGHADLKEIMGRSVLEWTHPDDYDRNAAAVEQCARDGSIFGFEVVYSGPDGKLTPIEINATVVHRDGVPQIVALCRDITERRRRIEKLQVFSQQMEKLVDERTAELTRTNEELHHSQKMELLGRLAGGITHDFNNLLGTISSYAEVLLKELPADAQGRGDIEDIVRETERGKQITRQLSDLSRKQPIVLKALNLNDIADKSLRMLKELGGPCVRFSSRLQPGLPDIKADEGQVSQVLMNLVVNARDAMPDGGEIFLSTGREQLAAPEKMPLQPKAGGYVTLSVSDTGPGIPEAMVPRIFEPFVTSKEEGKGTGLGLSIVYGIISKSGGGIALETGTKGTTFKIYFPEAEGS